MSVPAHLPENHRLRLDWFASRAGQKTFFPEQLPDGSFLVSRPKGIYKPQGFDHAVSVRINLDSPYADGKIRTRPDGSWYFDYHQENSNPGKRDAAYTNRALMACMRDSLPVGVLRERDVPKGRRPEYDVLGLAVPVGWREDYFFFESVAGPAGPRGDTAEQILTATAEDDLSSQAMEMSLPADDYDARRRAYRQIVARRGQKSFRSELLEAYGARCAISGSSTVMVLEAAHLRPYRGALSNAMTNGLLLRSDLHTLLDLQLLAFDPESRRVVLSRVLAGGDYAELAGLALREPRATHQRPADVVLAAVHAAFQHAEEQR